MEPATKHNLSIRDLLSKSFIFEGVVLFKIFENKTPSKITRYTVVLHGTIIYFTLYVTYIANYSRWKIFVVFADRSVTMKLFQGNSLCKKALGIQDYLPTVNVFQRITV